MTTLFLYLVDVKLFSDYSVFYFLLIDDQSSFELSRKYSFGNIEKDFVFQVFCTKQKLIRRWNWKKFLFQLRKYCSLSILELYYMSTHGCAAISLKTQDASHLCSSELASQRWSGLELSQRHWDLKNTRKQILWRTYMNGSRHSIMWPPFCSI